MMLTDDELRIVKQILHEHIPHASVAVFGSRAKGTKKEHADLDLLIRAETPLSLETFGMLREAFSDSDLPFRVDIVDARSVSENFLRQIESEAVDL